MVGVGLSILQQELEMKFELSVFVFVNSSMLANISLKGLGLLTVAW